MALVWWKRGFSPRFMKGTVTTSGFGEGRGPGQLSECEVLADCWHSRGSWLPPAPLFAVISVVRTDSNLTF